MKSDKMHKWVDRTIETLERIIEDPELSNVRKSFESDLLTAQAISDRLREADRMKKNIKKLRNELNRLKDVTGPADYEIIKTVLKETK